jgi:uncharacterized LabA/DUF88 family protein
MEPVYLFVGGEYLRSKFTRIIEGIFQTAPSINYQALMAMSHASKMFFYDCIDERQRRGETASAAATRITQRRSELGAINSLFGSHVRTGTITGARRRQKQVDVQLAVDMLTFAFRGTFRRAVLVSGDLDFKPVVQSLVSFGAFIEVWFEAKSASRRLLNAADHRVELTPGMCFEMADETFKSKNTLPIHRQTQPSSRYGLHIATAKERQNALITREPRKNRALLRHTNTQDIQYEHDDREVLRRYVELLHGPIEWIDWN